KNTQHNLFAEQRRTGADAEVDRLALGKIQLDAAVLRHAALGDIETRHHFQARGYAGRQLDWWRCYRAEHAVHTQTHTIRGFVRLEMDVRSAALDGVDQHLVHEAD